jgi:hypothetical protein
MEDVPTIPASASILQCIKGVINIFETAAAVDFQIIDRESMLALFDEQREQRLLHDENILKTLHAIYEICEQDEAILRKLHTWTVHGTKKTTEKETMQTDEREFVSDVIELE